MAANPMLDLINKQRMSPMKDVLNKIQSAQNPTLLFSQLMSKNPHLQEVVKYIQDNGGDPERAFYKMAQERGVDPESILNQLR